MYSPEGNSKQNQNPATREFVEMIARAAAEDVDESGAFSLGDAFKIGKNIWGLGKQIFGGG